LHSSKNVANPKACFEFVQEVYHQILRHILIRWFDLFQATDRLLLGWQSKNLRGSEAVKVLLEDPMPLNMCLRITTRSLDLPCTVDKKAGIFTEHIW